MSSRKPIIKIRKERNHYLAYFIELRRVIPVNDVAAEILDRFFNHQDPIEKILKIFKDKYKLTKKDIKNFLYEIEMNLSAPYEGGYPVIEREQMEIPLAVELQVNTTCNLRCKHCCQHDYVDVMSLRRVKSILNILYKSGVFEIILVGGEVFLHPDIKEIIKLSCEKYHFATFIVTNGTLLNSSLIRYLLRFKKNLAFLVSLEGIGEINDKIRNKGTFQKVDKALRVLRKSGFHVEISATINNLNIDYYQDLINYSRFLNVPINFTLFKPFKDGHDSLILSPEKYFEFIRNIFRQKMIKKLNIGITNAAIMAEMLNRPNRNECKATLSGLTIDVKGRMVPCSFLSEIGFYDKEKLPMFDENFLETWRNNKYFREFRKRNLQECQACSYIFKKDINKKNPYGVSAFKKYIKKQKMQKMR